MDIPQLVDSYINSKKLAWARTTLKNERARLLAHGQRVTQEPTEAYKELLLTMTPYSIKTTITRLGLFYQWLVDSNQLPAARNPWRKFLEDNALLFKYAYQMERVIITFEEAKSRILEMDDPKAQKAALLLLEGGLRYCELKTFDGSKVIGKGSKPRQVFIRNELKDFRYNMSYAYLYTQLKEVGLKPHTLRKLCATKLSRHPDIKDQDICKIFGWSSIETSLKYRQPHSDLVLGNLMAQVIGNSK